MYYIIRYSIKYYIFWFWAKQQKLWFFNIFLYYFSTSNLLTIKSWVSKFVCYQWQIDFSQLVKPIVSQSRRKITFYTVYDTCTVYILIQYKYVFFFLEGECLIFFSILKKIYKYLYYFLYLMHLKGNRN